MTACITCVEGRGRRVDVHFWQVETSLLNFSEIVQTILEGVLPDDAETDVQESCEPSCRRFFHVLGFSSQHLATSS